jgi:heat shock protein HtpX
VNHTAWLARRAMLAISLMIGFYVLAMGVVVLLLWMAYGSVVSLELPNPQTAYLCVATAVAILVAIFPRPDKFVPPGPRVDESSHQRLFAAIREVASVLKQEMPSDVYLVNDVNAWVTHRGGIMGFGSHRVIGLGLPLLQGFTVGEFKAVLAHEFGHYAAGDVSLGPWIYKTRAAIGRAVATLEDSILAGLFVWYSKIFLRLTHAISRRQEFIADALAARTVHPDIMASALRRTPALTVAFHSFWQYEMAPALNAGCVPPIMAGFEAYLASDAVSSAVHQLVGRVESEQEPDPYDTHPLLIERLSALSGMARPGAEPEPGPPAATLLPDIEADARDLLEFIVGGSLWSQLRKVEWSELAQVYAKQWRELTRQWTKFLGEYTTDTLPCGFEAFKKAGSRLMAGDAELRVERACQAFSVGVALALLDTGAIAETRPGCPVVFRKGDASIEPFAAVAQLAEGTLTIEEWRARCEVMGIAGRTLSPAVALAS